MSEADGRPDVADDRPALAPGTRIGDAYLVLKVAELGSAALSYEGLRLADQTGVTLHEFFPRGLAGRAADNRVAAIRGWEADFDAALARFSARADALTGLDAPAIVAPVDQVRDLGTLYIVSGSTDAPTLSGWASDLLRRPSDSDVARLALRLGEALRSLHAAGMGHGAVSDQQLHVSAPGDVVLTGVMLEATTAAEAAHADVCALAAALYSVVTGRAPPPSGRDRSLDARFASLHMAAGDYSDGLLAVIDAALELGDGAEKVEPHAWIEDLIATSRAILGEGSHRAAPPASVAAPAPASQPEERPQSRPVAEVRRAKPSEKPAPVAGIGRKNPVQLIAAAVVVLAGLAVWLGYLLLGQPPVASQPPRVAMQAERPAATPPEPPKPAAAEPVPASPEPAVAPAQASVALPVVPPTPQPPAAPPVVTAAEIARADTREAVLALLERGADRAAGNARLAALGFVAIATGGEPVFRKPGGAEVWRDCPTCPELVLVPPGATTMQVTLAEVTKQLDFRFDEPLAVARFEVTRGQYAAFVRETGRASNTGCHARKPAWGLNPALNWENPGFTQADDHPVVCVSFQDASAYAEWLSARTGQRYRLPSDAEWHYLASAEKWSEKAPEQLCRIGNGADLSALAGNPEWQHAACEDGFAETSPVGTFAPGPWGLHDLNGNAWEWVTTCAPDPTPEAVFPPLSCPAGAPRLLRGGSWADAPKLRLLDSRVISAPAVRDQVAGFRVVRVP